MNTFDEVHEKISELIIRVSKLEQYKRLQDHINTANNNKFDQVYDDLKDLDRYSTITLERIIRIEDITNNKSNMVDLVNKVDNTYYKRQGLTIEDAFKLFKQGKSIKRSGMGHIFPININTVHVLRINIEDITALDWEVTD